MKQKFFSRLAGPAPLIVAGLIILLAPHSGFAQSTTSKAADGKNKVQPAAQSTPKQSTPKQSTPKQSTPKQAVVKAAPTVAPKEPTGAEVVAIVDGENILYSDVMAARRTLPAQYQQIPMQTIYLQLLNQVIERHVLASAAIKSGQDKDVLVQAGLRQARNRVLSSSYARYLVSQGVTEERVRAIYNKDKDAKTGPVEVRARHILVQTEAEARSIIMALKKGGDFVALAKTKSTGPSGARGGDLGYFKKGAMVPAFSAAAFSLKPGEISDPVKTQFGWHVIKVEDRRSSAGPSFKKEAGKIRQKLAAEIIQAEVAKQRKTVKIETFMPNGKPIPLPPK
jgi:peptidyl-prolyl cis-trans isomerase C